MEEERKKGILDIGGKSGEGGVPKWQVKLYDSYGNLQEIHVQRGGLSAKVGVTGGGGSLKQKGGFHLERVG